MYFKDFPQFLYDFNYGDGKVHTAVVKDITRNIRVKKEILSNVVLFEEYDIVDGETPEIISEKFYGSPEYHWVVMLANDKYDYRADFPMPEPVLQRHIASVYNPVLYSDDWYWEKDSEGLTTFYIKITSVEVPFEVAYLTAPVKILIEDDDKSFVHNINYPVDPIGLDENTQYFYFPIQNHTPWLTSHSKPGYTETRGIGNVRLKIQTQGREHNPVFFLDNRGQVVNPSTNALPVTGDSVYRTDNDKKRKIKIISPTLLETLIKNYEELLR